MRQVHDSDDAVEIVSEMNEAFASAPRGCRKPNRLEEDAKGEIDRAAVREQPDRLVQVDVGPQRNLPGRERVVPGPHQLHDAPPLHALDLRLDDLVYRGHPDFLYEIFVCPTNGDMGLVGSNCVVSYRTLYGFFTREGARVVGLTNRRGSPSSRRPETP